MLIRKLVVVGLVGIMSLAAQVAHAEEVARSPVAAVENVNFADIESGSHGFADRLSVQFGPAGDNPFASLTSLPRRAPDRGDRDASYEVALLARGARGFDVAAAQSGAIGFDNQGDVARERRSSELRFGRGLIRQREAASAPTWYVFIADEDEALTWRPGGQRNAFGGSDGAGLALQDRVEIGDLQAGITYEAYGMQASLAYVERDFTVEVGTQNFSGEERFVGLTLTLRN